MFSRRQATDIGTTLKVQFLVICLTVGRIIKAVYVDWEEMRYESDQEMCNVREGVEDTVRCDLIC